MYDTILIPTDGSDPARRAAEHAVVLRDVFDATVHVVSVVDIDAAAGPINAGGVDEEFVDRLRDDARERLADVESLFDGDGLETTVVEGTPADAILEYVDGHDVDLVTMGTHGRTGVRRYVAGSVTEDVLRRSPVPVLTARVTDASVPDGGYDDILFPTDGSQRANAALNHCLAVASAFDATVHVVTVVNIGAVSGDPEGAVPVDLLDSLRKRGQRTVDSVADDVRTADLDVVTQVVDGFPARDILAYADEHAIDLVTMGTAGQTGLSRFLLGSTTERVIRHADMPVLAVNTRDEGEDD